MRKLTIALCLMACQCAAGQDIMARNMQLAARRVAAESEALPDDIALWFKFDSAGTAGTYVDSVAGNNGTQTTH